MARHMAQRGDSVRPDGSAVTGDPVLLQPRLDEPACFDPVRLETLCLEIGEARAEAEVAHALDRISTTLMRLYQLIDGADAAHLRAAVDRLARDADMIGMTTLARVASDVVSCIEGSDRIAFAATIARLDRVGDRSIHAVWELEELSR